MGRGSTPNAHYPKVALHLVFTYNDLDDRAITPPHLMWRSRKSQLPVAHMNRLGNGVKSLSLDY